MRGELSFFCLILTEGNRCAEKTFLLTRQNQGRVGHRTGRVSYVELQQTTCESFETCLLIAPRVFGVGNPRGAGPLPSERVGSFRSRLEGALFSLWF